MKLSLQLASCVALLDWLTECYQSVRLRWTRPPYGEFVANPLQVQEDRWRGVDSQDAPRQLPLALRLKSGCVYVGSKTVHNHAELWIELHDGSGIRVEEIADLGFWCHGTYCPSKSAGPGARSNGA